MINIVINFLINCEAQLKKLILSDNFIISLKTDSSLLSNSSNKGLKYRQPSDKRNRMP